MCRIGRQLDRHLQILGRPERDFFACFDLDRFAGCGITPHAGCTIPDLQNAEAGNALLLDAVLVAGPRSQRISLPYS
jgi:hypothetical protein